MHPSCFAGWEHGAEFVALFNSTQGKIIWGNGKRHQMLSDGTIELIEPAGA
jgi:hypothetical protein